MGRLATRKFGARTAERLSRVLAGIADPERLAEVADAIMDCDSDAELFAWGGDVGGRATGVPAERRIPPA